MFFSYWVYLVIPGRMDLINFGDLSLVIICVIFICASALVWLAGTRLSRYTDALAKKTGTADVVMGTLLLGGVTSLPEVVTTITASSIGNADIAINNLFGGVALQVTILALADMTIKKRSFSSLIGSPVVQLQAIVGILILSITACIIIVGDRALFHIGIGSILILLMFGGGFYLINYFQSIRWWKSDPDKRDNIKMAMKSAGEQIADQEELQEQKQENETVQSFRSMLKTRLFFYLLLSAAAVLTAGYAVVQTGQVIATRTGLGSSVIGAILIAFSTSLPELSTTISSVRLQEYRLAFSNIFGTNIFTIGFVFLGDVFYKKGPILNEVDNFSLFAAMLGIALTAIYMIGLSMRFKKTFLNMGYDSILVIIGYLTGIVIMLTVIKA